MALQEIIKSLLIYVVIATCLRGLIVNQKYQQYFRFFSGMVMILLLLVPLLSFLGNGDNWYDALEEIFLKVEKEDIRSQMRVADRDFEKLVCDEYQETVKKQIILLAKKERVALAEVSVEMEQGEEGWEITKIRARASEMETDAGEGGEPLGQGDAASQKDMERVRKKICDYFLVGKEQVQLWS